MLDFEHPDNQKISHQQVNHHQVSEIDEFTEARIHRLWGAWLRDNPSEWSNKHQFYHRVILREPGLERIRLATVYVLLARYDAQLVTELSPA